MKHTVKLKHIILILIGLSLLFDTLPALSREADVQTESDLSRIIKKIKDKERNLKTFTAYFKQVKTSQLLRDPLHSEGLIYVDTSGRMLMKVISPLPLILLLKNDQQMIYYPALSRVEKKPFPNTDDIFKLYIGMGESIQAMQSKFDIQLVSNPHSEHYHLKMTPKQRSMAKHLMMIEVVVNPKHWLPEQIHFKEKKGENTTIQMQFTSINEPLPSDIFEIEVPADMEANSRGK
ncbi:MAG: outer membrane lipoprotein carrier protein LolA [Desulfobacterales bacterium]|nr:MAG: outer membrane lipoprotein carrier protein LolA [Desulfobacterales bacterium]